METPMPSGSISTGATTSRKAAHASRRLPACERCNKRRVKCDASVIGHPCSNCHHSGTAECRFIRSRRVRGSGGRFIAPSESEGRSQTLRAEYYTTTSTSQQPQPKQSKGASPRTAQNPQFSLDLDKLYDDGSLNLASAAASGEGMTATGSAPAAKVTEVRNRSKGRPVFVGESWFASFLAHNAAAGNTDVAQPVEIARGNEENRTRSTSPRVDSERPADADIDAITAAPSLPKDLPPKHLMRRLIEAFFARFHVHFPILDKASFSSAFEDGGVSITLLRSVMFVGSTRCDRETYHLLGFSTRNDAGDELFGLAKSSFDADTTSDRTAMLQSCFLLHCWWGQPTAIKDSLWWFAVAIRSAQCMGMHRTTCKSSLSRDTQILWKRIWWCLYIRDRQIAFAVGVPMVINELDCSVEYLSLDDFPDETLETANYVMEQVRLNRAASEMYFRHCSPTRLPLCTHPEARHRAQQEIWSTLQAWHNGLPEQCQRERRHHLSLTLEMCYYFYIINLQQRLHGECNRDAMSQENDEIILEAANSITRVVEDAMIYWSPEYFPMMWVTGIFAAMNVQFVSYRRLNKQERELILTRLRTSLIALKQFEECYILARWVRILWSDIFDRSSRKTITRQGVPPTNSTPDCSSIGSHPQIPFEPQPSPDTGGLPGRPHAAELECTSGRWLDESPYSTTDWSNLVLSGGYEAAPGLPLNWPNSIDQDGLQFLANLGLSGYSSHWLCQ